MPYPSYPDEYRQKFYEDGHYKSIYFVESMNNVEIVPGEDLKVNPVEDPLRPGNKTIVFTEEQLIREKFTYKEYLNAANNICVGSCECNSIEFTIRNNGVIPPLFYNTGTEQVERTFKVYVYFDHDSSTLLPLGMFRVVDDSLSGDKKERNIIMCDYMNTLRDLDAYDWYQNFKKAHPNGSTLKVFRDSFWDFMQNPDPKKGIKFPVTQKTQTLINDDVTIAYTLDEDTILLSAGNIIEDLCEINGVWGRFSRDVDSQNRSIFEYVEMPHITSKTKITKWRSIEPFQRDRYITHDWYQTKPIHAVTIRNAYDANIAQYASAELETRDNEGNVIGRFGNYAIYDNKFIDEIKSSGDNTSNDTDPEDDPITPVTGFDFLKRVCKNVLSKIKYVKYTPYELTTVGDLARTCGDIIYVNGTGEDDVIEELQDYTHFFSYVFERELKGIQNMRDTYRAKGDRVLPMFGDSSSSSGYTSSGGGGAYVVQSSGITGGTGIAENVNTTGKADGVPLEYWPELIRNVGLRVPDSPKGKVVFDKATGAATITWTDPADYDDNKPIPSVWEKTYLLRSYKGRPWNIYDPSIEVLVTETVKDTYKTNGFVDSTAGQHDKVFYAIFPQNTAGYVNPFTVLSIKPDRTMEAPAITDVKNPTAHSITVDHTIPDQTSTYSKKVVVANPDHEPLDATDGIATLITNFASTVVSGLEQNRDYYFKVFLVKASGAESESDYDEGKTTEELNPTIDDIFDIGATSVKITYTLPNWTKACQIAAIDSLTGSVYKTFYEGSSSSTETLTGLKFGGMYRFELRAYSDPEMTDDPVTDTSQDIQLAQEGSPVYALGWSYNDWSEDSVSGIRLATNVEADIITDYRGYSFASANHNNYDGTIKEAMLDYYINTSYTSFNYSGVVTIEIPEIIMRVNRYGYPQPTNYQYPYLKLLFRSWTSSDPKPIEQITLGYNISGGEKVPVIQGIPETIPSNDYSVPLTYPGEDQRHNVKLRIPSVKGYIKGTIELLIDDVVTDSWVVDTNVSGIAPINSRFNYPNSLETMYFCSVSMWGIKIYQSG